MGKWIARLEVELACPPPEAPDETLKTSLEGVLSVLSVGFDRGLTKSAPVEPGPDLSAVAWTDADIARFLAVQARLRRWGWAESEAEEMSARIVNARRDGDDRVSCIDCRHHRPGRCSRHRDAGLHSFDVGRDLSGLLQRCPGFEKAP